MSPVAIAVGLVALVILLAFVGGACRVAGAADDRAELDLARIAAGKEPPAE